MEHRRGYARCFNPRARAGRDLTDHTEECSLDGFNPRARAGRDRAIEWQASQIFLFQSTRPRGARLASCGIFCPSAFCFNPRARAGRDSYDATRRFSLYVSIHAPARGATGNVVVAHVAVVFQSTRPRGARPSFSVSVAPAIMFQSTRPRGARPASFSLILRLLLCFNPRARAGRDHSHRRNRNGRERFQSTRPRGARRGRQSKVY